MSYSKDTYDRAISVIQNRNRDAEHRLEERRNEVYSKNAQLKKLEDSINLTGVELARAVVHGSDAKKQVEKIKQHSEKIRNKISEELARMGLDNDYLKVQYHCPNCGDTGFKDGKMCVCLKKALRDQAFNKLNELSPLERSRFEDFRLEYYSNVPAEGSRVSARKRMTDIYEYCKKYAEDFKPGFNSILMQGNTGLGKTHLSLAIARRVIDKGYGVVYGSVPTLISKLEREHFSYNRQESETEDYLIDCDLLILDDLGTEFITNFSKATIYNILNSRLLMDKPTIISTNLSVKEMEGIYSERFVSRIMGNNDRLEFLGKDLRQKIRNLKR